MLPLDLITAALLPLADSPAGRGHNVSRSYDRVAVCADPLARLLARVGWHGRDNAIAWSIAMRESNGQPDAAGGGGYGLFQLQASVWAGTDIWPADWSDAESNARAAHQLWQRLGWRPWGINATGDGIDARDYAGWDASRQWAWIWQPFAQWRAAYPCEVAP